MQYSLVAQLRAIRRHSLILIVGTDIVIASESKSTPSQVIRVEGSDPFEMFSCNPSFLNNDWKRRLPRMASPGDWADATSSMYAMHGMPSCPASLVTAEVVRCMYMAPHLMPKGTAMSK